MRQATTIALILSAAVIAAPRISAAGNCNSSRHCTPCAEDVRSDALSCCRPPAQCRRPAAQSWSYNTDYLFAASRLLNDECSEPAACLPLAPLALALDLVALPLTAGFGLFGN